MASLEYVLEAAPQDFPLTEAITLVGRDPSLTLAFPQDLRISRCHCCIKRQEDGRFLLADENSRNGTYLNGARVSADGVLLCDGDKITVGATDLLFRDPAVGRTAVAFNEVAAEMAKGKGFHTIMHQIVKKP